MGVRALGEFCRSLLDIVFVVLDEGVDGWLEGEVGKVIDDFGVFGLDKWMEGGAFEIEG